MKSNLPEITPIPMKIEQLNGNLKINLLQETPITLQTSNSTKIRIENLEYVFYHFLNLILNQSIESGLKTTLESGSKLEFEESDSVLSFNEDNSKKISPGSYRILINPSGISIKSNDADGAFYGLMSLIQIIYWSNTKNIGTDTHRTEQKKIDKNSFIIELPCLEILDKPRFEWRGFMLDVGRHFFKPEVIKKILDIMALLKMNKFHWHLTEDQGWRIEIQKYPKLIEVGSFRKESQIGGYLSRKADRTPHSGYYSQEQIREIIQYAHDRFIQVIPEVDIPGHSMAALTSYPEYSCTGGPFEVPTTFGIKKDVFCVGKESTFNFIFSILDELLELFPDPYFHIGGDEVPKDRWLNCPDCVERMKSLNLSDARQLQAYFTNRIFSYLNDKKRTMIGWNEILNENLPNIVIGQYWARHFDKVLGHVKNGGKVVMSKFGQVYLDYNYGLTPLRKTYSYDPIPKGIDPELIKNIIGIEAPLWTEWVNNEQRLYWQTFPRLIAVAETGWSQKELKNYDYFRIRLPGFMNMIKLFHVGSANLDEADPSLLKRLYLIVSFLKAPKGEAVF